MKTARKQSKFTLLCYYNILDVTLGVYLPLSIMLLSCTGIEEDSNYEYSDEYEMNTVQEEADGGDDDDYNDDDDDNQKNEDAMRTSFALPSKQPIHKLYIHNHTNAQ